MNQESASIDKAFNSTKSSQVGLELFLQRPDGAAVDRLPTERDSEGNALYPEVDSDGDHVHFEMIPMKGETYRITPSQSGLPARTKDGPDSAAAGTGPETTVADSIRDAIWASYPDGLAEQLCP